MAIASSGVAATDSDSTGPKISSRVGRLPCATLVRTVGSRKWPLSPPGATRFPPRARVAPSATAAATCRSTVARASSEMSGPRSVEGSMGSPRRTVSR